MAHLLRQSLRRSLHPVLNSSKAVLPLSSARTSLRSSNPLHQCFVGGASGALLRRRNHERSFVANDSVPFSLSKFVHVQHRTLHTSPVLHGRSSFATRIKNKIQNLRKDEGAINRLLGIGAVGYSVAKVSKFGAVLKFAFPILKMTKVMPLMSMGLSTIFYSWFFGFPFAVGMVSLMFSSQAARAVLLKWFGCEVSPMAMIPFFGTISTEQVDPRKTEEFVLQNRPFDRCLVALAPVAGMFAFTSTIPLGVGGVMLGSQCGYAVANTGFMMGMFSLLPLGDMTPGGLLLSHFSKHALLLGTLFNAGLIFVLPNPILYVCLFLNLYRLYQRGFTIMGRQFGGSEDEPNFEAGSGVATNYFTDYQKVVIASLYWMMFLLNAGGLAMVSTSLLAPGQLRQQQAQEEHQKRQELGLLDPYDPRGRTPHGAFGASDSEAANGFSFGDWALDNLNAVEQLDKEEDDFDREWRRQQQMASEEARRTEEFR